MATATANPPNPEVRPRPYVPAKQIPTDYPLIDSDPHFKRVLRYARPIDWAAGGAMAVGGPAALFMMEKVSPTYVGRGGFASAMRLITMISATCGFMFMYQRSCTRFYGFEENRREVEMDMREMVDKVKKGEPLYGHSTLSEYMQGVASRNSRYSSLMFHLIPWFNFVNHNHHGVDTAKYYQQAERELEAERLKSLGSSSTA